MFLKPQHFAGSGAALTPLPSMVEIVGHRVSVKHYLEHHFAPRQSA